LSCVFSSVPFGGRFTGSGHGRLHTSFIQQLPALGNDVTPLAVLKKSSKDEFDKHCSPSANVFDDIINSIDINSIKLIIILAFVTEIRFIVILIIIPLCFFFN
jgi:hypothetical protein